MILKTSQPWSYVPFTVLLTFELYSFLSPGAVWSGCCPSFFRHVQQFSGFASHKSNLSDLFSWCRMIVYEVWKFNIQSAFRPYSFWKQFKQRDFYHNTFGTTLHLKKSFCQVDCQVEDPLCNCKIIFICLEGKGWCPSFVEGALMVASLLQAVQEAHDSRDLNTSGNYWASHQVYCFL